VESARTVAGSITKAAAKNIPAKTRSNDSVRFCLCVSVKYFKRLCPGHLCRICDVVYGSVNYARDVPLDSVSHR